EVDQADRAPLRERAPSRGVAPLGADDAGRETGAVGERAPDARRGAGAHVGEPVAVQVAHADRAVVAGRAPADVVRPARALDALIEARSVGEPAPEALRVTGAEIVLAVAVHVGEADRRVVARGVPAVRVADAVAPHGVGREAVAGGE